MSLCHLALLAISRVRAGFRRLYRHRALPGDLRRASEEHRAAPVRTELEVHCHDERRGYPQPRRTKVKGLAFQARETLMICRQPREAECREIRTQLAVLTGRALRRGQLRHHVEHCEDCRAFEIEVRRQRAGLAILLSVVPSLTLKHSVLIGLSAAAGNDLAAGSATAATGGGRVAVTGGDGAMASGEAAAGAQSVAARLLLALVGEGGARWRALTVVERVRDDSSLPLGSRTETLPRNERRTAMSTARTFATLVPPANHRADQPRRGGLMTATIAAAMRLRSTYLSRAGRIARSRASGYCAAQGSDHTRT